MLRNSINLGKNYKGKEIIINREKEEFTCFNILNDYTNWKNSNIREDEKLNSSLNLLKEIYKKMIVVEEELYPYLTCGKGCSYCCYLYVECSPLEGALINEYVKDNFSKEDLKSLNYKKDVIKVKLKELQEKKLSYLDMIKTYKAEQNPCLFLKEGTCNIYSVRPFNCRAMHSISNLIGCIENKEIERVKLELYSVVINSIYKINLEVYKKEYGENIFKNIVEYIK